MEPLQPNQNPEPRQPEPNPEPKQGSTQLYDVFNIEYLHSVRSCRTTTHGAEGPEPHTGTSRESRHNTRVS
ncbi:hypothetical protein DPMN_040164 [Dreissena polymorpha]|uniref:Uncharacterized protein n=1 Tax=Dreissena polymorpha TaxID=45954 RepID=A0A9D4CWM4_DREPO|nr:hypothetical protein DPMN_040164 [Dreissena polymorpha]